MRSYSPFHLIQQRGKKNEETGLGYCFALARSRLILFNHVSDVDDVYRFHSLLFHKLSPNLPLDWTPGGWWGIDLLRDKRDKEEERFIMRAFKQLIYPFSVGIALLPSKAFAHGGAEEPSGGLPLSMYGLVAMGLLLILFVAFYLNVKKKVQALQNVKKNEDRKKREQLSKRLQLIKWGWILSIVGVVITGSLTVMGDRLTAEENEVYLEHVHGLGYSADGKRIVIPAHDGLKSYSDGHWDNAEGEKHDYMGFAAVDDGFYSSGHPAPGSDKKNPFGVVKSTDEGKTFKTLDLYEEIDFHLMGVGYQSHAIYVINPQPNSRMDSTGLYYSIDDTKTWTKSAMTGISEEPTAIAVHPIDKAVVAIGTETGVYLSKDNGDNFEKVISKGQATSLFFNSNGTFFVGGYSDKSYLLKWNVENKQSDEIIIPDLTEDAIAYIAENPIKANEITFATFKKDVYVSNDNGDTWTKVADQGKGIEEKKQ